MVSFMGEVVWGFAGFCFYFGEFFLSPFSLYFLVYAFFFAKYVCLSRAIYIYMKVISKTNYIYHYPEPLRAKCSPRHLQLLVRLSRSLVWLHITAIMSARRDEGDNSRGEVAEKSFFEGS